MPCTKLSVVNSVHWIRRAQNWQNTYHTCIKNKNTELKSINFCVFLWLVIRNKRIVNRCFFSFGVHNQSVIECFKIVLKSRIEKYNNIHTPTAKTMCSNDLRISYVWLTTHCPIDVFVSLLADYVCTLVPTFEAFQTTSSVTKTTYKQHHQHHD